MQGRLSIHVDPTTTEPARGMSASFQLRGNGQAGELRVDSPLGLRVASARWAPGLAMLSTASGERRFGTLEELSREVLGEAMPLAALPDWLSGRPWPGAPSAPEATGFEQLGWNVLTLRVSDGWVEAHREAPPAVVLRARLETPL